MAKSNKIDKNEELIAGYQEAECLWNVLPPSHKDINFRRMTFTTGCTAPFLLGGVGWGRGGGGRLSLRPKFRKVRT